MTVWGVRPLPLETIVVAPVVQPISEERSLGNSRTDSRKNTRTNPWQGSPQTTSVRAAFTLIEVLVSIAVIAIMISLLIPGLNKAQETARRVACASSLRQFGYGISTYAEDSKDRLPPSGYFPEGWGGASRSATGEPDQMLIVRVAEAGLAYKDHILWDGLGRLFYAGYLAPGKVFYCPSHRGQHPFSKYMKLWGASKGEIVSNYQYRGMGVDGKKLPKLFQIEPSATALAADGMRSQSDYNHRVGLNYLRADLGVSWLSDPGGDLARFLPENDDDSSGSSTNSAWDWIDESQGDHSRGR